jgi:alcohol dehydrogenase class IV
MISRFSFPTNIVFGAGALQEVGPLAVRLGASRALIVTDRGVVSAGLIDPVRASLQSAGVASIVFDGIDPNPTDENVESGIELYRQELCDLIVGVGGGSPLDGAKAIRLRATHNLPLADYDDNIGGDKHITSDVPPMLALPTTAGTGSEVGRSTVLILKATERKTVIFSPHLMPTYAVCDPELTVSMPPMITAATGMDALTHNLEAYLSTPFHPMADGLALHGLRLCARSLAKAVKEGTDLNARADMMMAAAMGATAFQKGLGATHSLAHPLSSIAGMHHGMANAVMLPYVLKFNAGACAQKLNDVAKVLDLPDIPEAVGEWITQLNSKIGIPDKLRGFGVTAEMIPALTEKAMQDGCHLFNPRPCTAADMRSLYEQAL